MPQTKKKHKLPVFDPAPGKVILGCFAQRMENIGGADRIRVTCLRTGEARIIRTAPSLRDPWVDYQLIKTVAEAMNISTADDR